MVGPFDTVLDKPIMNFVRFIMVSGIGFVLDMLISIFLHEAGGLPLWLAATIGFFIVAALNYLLFETWVFRSSEVRFSSRRLVGVILCSMVAVWARIGTILVLDDAVESVLGDGRPKVIALLLVGGCASVIVNFYLNRRVVFRETPNKN